MPWIAAVIAGAMAAGKSYASGMSNNISAEYEKKTSLLNAQLAKMKAELALKEGVRAQAQLKAQAGIAKAEQKAGYAASGIDVNSRSAQNVYNSTDVASEIDRLQIEENALRNAWDARLEAVNQENNARMAQAKKVNVGRMVMTESLMAGAMAYFMTEKGGTGNENKPAPITDKSSYSSGSSGTLLSSDSRSFTVGGNTYGYAGRTFSFGGKRS